jgi:hypothetical protein
VRKRSQGDHRRDCVKGILLGRARCNQGGADARVKANLLIDGPAIGLEGAGLEGAGVQALGLAKHRADEPVEQIDGLVCQIGAQVERNSDQGRMTALTFVARDMRKIARSIPGSRELQRLLPERLQRPSTMYRAKRHDRKSRRTRCGRSAS